jgi:hypothetical protein
MIGRLIEFHVKELRRPRGAFPFRLDPDHLIQINGRPAPACSIPITKPSGRVLMIPPGQKAATIAGAHVRTSV